jgi:hypothetical protein
VISTRILKSLEQSTAVSEAPHVLRVHSEEVCGLENNEGRVVAKAVTSVGPRRLWFEPRSVHMGFLVDKVALGRVSSAYFGFFYEISFHRLLYTHHHPSSWAGTVVADTQRGHVLTPHQGTTSSQLPEI